jgi:transposase
MARSGALLSEAQWKKIAPLLPKPPTQRQRGRPWIENRRVLEGILGILRSGARWQDLPENFPHPSTCWRRLRDWEERGVCTNAWLGNFRRLVVRYDPSLTIYGAFFHIACFMIVLRRVVQ